MGMLTHIASHLRKHFKGFCSSPEVIMLFVYHKLRFSLSYRELEEMSHIRGATIDHSTLARWVVRFAPLLEAQVRKRKKPVSGSWRMDETYVKLQGKWIYLYRAVDSKGHTVEFLLRENRDKAAAVSFFRKALSNNECPAKINIDKSGSNLAALTNVNKELSQEAQIEIRQSKYLNNRVEQDHRFIKKRTRPMLGFKSFYAAKMTLNGIESIRMIQKAQIFGADKGLYAFENYQTLMGA